MRGVCRYRCASTIVGIVRTGAHRACSGYEGMIRRTAGERNARHRIRGSASIRRASSRGARRASSWTPNRVAEASTDEQGGRGGLCGTPFETAGDRWTNRGSLRRPATGGIGGSDRGSGSFHDFGLLQAMSAGAIVLDTTRPPCHLRPPSAPGDRGCRRHGDREGGSCEADLPAEEQEAREQARLPRAQEQPGGPERARAAPTQGPEALVHPGPEEVVDAGPLGFEPPRKPVTAAGASPEEATGLPAAPEEGTTGLRPALHLLLPEGRDRSQPHRRDGLTEGRQRGRPEPDQAVGTRGLPPTPRALPGAHRCRRHREEGRPGLRIPPHSRRVRRCHHPVLRKA